MMNIAICDDNAKDVDTLYEFVDEIFAQYDIIYKIIKCSNGADLLYEVNEVGSFDLIFLDIELGIDNGIDTATEIRKRNPYCYIFFVSGHERYYKAAFSVQPYQFIDKPIDFNELKTVVNSVACQVMDNDQVFAFGNKWKQYRIRLDDILYFISDYRLIKVYTKDESCYEFYGKMNEVQAELDSMTKIFLRVHKSYLLNMCHIKIFQSDSILMQNDKLFPISTRKRSSVIERYMKFVSILDKF